MLRTHGFVDVAQPESYGRAVQVAPMNPKLKAPGTKLLKLEHEKLLFKFAFNFNLRHYTTATLTSPRGPTWPRPRDHHSMFVFVCASGEKISSVCEC